MEIPRVELIVKSTRESDTDKIGNEEHVDDPSWIWQHRFCVHVNVLPLLRVIIFRLPLVQAHVFADAGLLPPPAPYEDGKHQEVKREQ